MISLFKEPTSPICALCNKPVRNYMVGHDYSEYAEGKIYTMLRFFCHDTVETQRVIDTKDFIQPFKKIADLKKAAYLV